MLPRLKSMFYIPTMFEDLISFNFFFNFSSEDDWKVETAGR